MSGEAVGRPMDILLVDGSTFANPPTSLMTSAMRVAASFDHRSPFSAVAAVGS